MIRFFTDPDNIVDNVIKLNAEDTEHIRSLRMRPDELFIVCDGKGTDYTCRLGISQSSDTDTFGQSSAIIVGQQKSQAEPSVKCTVYIAYAKGERLDFAVQKSVELGAHKIVLFKSERSVAVPKDIEKKTQRLQRIAIETAKQSGRGIIPDVSSIGDFDNAVDAASRSDLALFCYEDETNLHLMTVLEHYFPFVIVIEKPMKKVKTISVITGPEGGFELSEVRLARSMDISVVSLGPRILRCETAPVAALSAIMYHTGNM